MRGWAHSRCLRSQRSLRDTTSRHFSGTAWLRIPRTEHIQVPCASAGHVTVRQVRHLTLRPSQRARLTSSHSLHDIARHPVLTPLIINLPASPAHDLDDVESYLPHFLHRYPSVTIHYRWPMGQKPEAISHRGPSSFSPSTRSGKEGRVSDINGPTAFHWPTPIHDTLAAYDHILKTLSPPPTMASHEHSKVQRRDIYAYGSYIGAGLAASLALTESHSREPMAVRGLLALNGVYNWTTFLPDHPVNTSRLSLIDETLDLGLGGFADALAADAEDLGMLRSLIPKFFQQPANLFDPFASPVLFFHSAGMLVPPGFNERWRPNYPFNAGSSSSSSSSSSSPAVGENIGIDPYDYVYSDPEDPPPPTPFPDSEIDRHADAETNSGSDSDLGASTNPEPDMAPPLRKGYLAFPPRTSTLRIPETLLLHSTPPPLPTIPDTVGSQRLRTTLWKQLKNAENSFGSQAVGLAGLMRRSVNKLELRERMRWGDESADWEGEAVRRIKTVDIGKAQSGRGSFGIGERTQEIATQWLQERVG